MRFKKWNDLKIYEIYPTSFYDANGDGIGDLRGVMQKLDYIQSLGVNAIWFNAFFCSAFSDAGYDVTDYYNIDSRFGTNEDLENLIVECDKRGMKVIVDIVIGHTSEQHPWFLDSCKQERNEHSDWFIWTDNIFADDERCIANPKERDGCYRINYYVTQPALNYGFDNPDPKKPWQWHYTDPRLEPLRQEVINILLFWRRKGVYGFRFDLGPSLVKNCQSPEPLAWVWGKIFEGVKKEFPDTLFMAEWGNPAVSVGECGFDIDYLMHEVPPYNQLFRNEPYTNIIRDFERGKNYFSEEGAGSIEEFLQYFEEIESVLKGKGGYILPSGYHDLIRLSKGKSEALLKVIFAFIYTWKAIPMLYYGDEIGMLYREGIHKDGGSVRTGSRTPMQWTDGKNRGFSTADSLYLPVDDSKISVQAQENDGLLPTVKALTKLAKKLPYDAPVKVLESGYPFVYERITEDGVYTVFLQAAARKAKTTLVYDEVIACENCKVENGIVSTDGVGYAIVYKKGENV